MIDSSIAYAGAPVQQSHRQREHRGDGSDHDPVRQPQVDIRRTQKTVAKRAHHVQDGIGVRCNVGPVGEHIDRIEHAAEIGERRQHERREPGYVVEVLREQGVDESAEREHHAGQQHGGDDGDRVRYLEAGEKERNQADGEADQQPAQHAAGDISAQDQPIWQRRYQEFLEVLAELGAEKGRYDVAEGIGDDGHHDESGSDELHVLIAVDLAHPLPDQAAENHEVQRRGHDRRDDGLAPDAHDAIELTNDDGRKSHPLGARARGGGHASGPCDGGAGADVDQADEEFLEPIHLVPHAVDFDALRRKPRENFIQILSLRHFDLERVIIGERGAESRKVRRRGQ